MPVAPVLSPASRKTLVLAPDSENEAPRTGEKKRRRAQVPPPEGTDPHPEGEPDRFSDDDNAERLKGDKPPHWG